MPAERAQGFRSDDGGSGAEVSCHGRAPRMTESSAAGGATPPGDAYLPLRMLALYAGLSVRTLRGYLTHPSRPLPHYRVGAKVLVKRSEYDAWMVAFREAGEGRVRGIVDELLGGV